MKKSRYEIAVDKLLAAIWPNLNLKEETIMPKEKKAPFRMECGKNQYVEVRRLFEISTGGKDQILVDIRDEESSLYFVIVDNNGTLISAIAKVKSREEAGSWQQQIWSLRNKIPN